MGHMARKGTLMKPTDEELERRATYHAPTPEARMAHEIVRDTILTAAIRIRDTVPESRELAMALTHLDEAMFCANAGIARNHDKLSSEPA